MAVKPFIHGRVLDLGCGSGKLAEEVLPEQYLGVDADNDVIERARRKYPRHQFEVSMPKGKRAFDTIVMLAVIEHLNDPGDLIRFLSKHLSYTDKSSLIITTPTPVAAPILTLGSYMGLFSKVAHEEHRGLISRCALELIGHDAGLSLILYRRFLFGMNQLAIYQRS
jgi:2-polyprenyl-3-methyl-5-hydroxy-6-metoxy-1,4-benzoquinol methylase